MDELRLVQRRRCEGARELGRTDKGDEGRENEGTEGHAGQRVGAQGCAKVVGKE